MHEVCCDWSVGGGGERKGKKEEKTIEEKLISIQFPQVSRICKKKVFCFFFVFCHVVS